MGWGSKNEILEYCLSSVLELQNFGSRRDFTEMLKRLSYSLLTRKQRPRQDVWLVLGHKLLQIEPRWEAREDGFTLRYTNEEIKSQSETLGHWNKQNPIAENKACERKQRGKHLFKQSTNNRKYWVFFITVKIYWILLFSNLFI